MTLLCISLRAQGIGLFLLRKSQGRRRQLDLPNGDIFYQDHHGQPMPAVLLHSRAYGVRGKPDCLIRTGDGIVPVELKKSARPPASGGVYPNRLIQVLAYIVLVRENYGEEVPYGLVLYGDEAARKVVPTPEDLAWLAEVVREVRATRGFDRPNRSHNHRSPCRVRSEAQLRSVVGHRRLTAAGGHLLSERIALLLALPGAQ